MAASDDIYLEIIKVVSNDIVEQILVRLGVTDLIRCKSVCKSWKSLISHPAFIKAHMNYSYNKDGNNNTTGHRRIVMARSENDDDDDDDDDDWLRPHRFYDPRHELDFDFYECNLLGSSNGLVCISPSYPVQLLVANPSTREVRKLQPAFETTPCSSDLSSLCWGFGYDSSVDDYKLILGSRKGTEEAGVTCFHVLSLKSNVWRFVGQVKYTRITKIGTLCNGALHWVMLDHRQNDKEENRVILSFNLSKKEFKEIPQPDNASYKCHYFTRVGVFEDCLCIYRLIGHPSHRWVMKNYNVQQSWEELPYNHVMKPDSAHLLQESKDYIPNKTSFFHDFMGSSKTWEYISAPIFVQTLVSPHANGTLKRKMLANNSNRNDKLIKGDGWAT